RWDYAWNALNQLVSAAPTPGALTAGHPAATYAYAYGHTGWRVEKTTSGSNPRTRYLYFGTDLIAEFAVTVNGSGVVTASQLSKSYYWKPGGPGPSGRLLGIWDHL